LLRDLVVLRVAPDGQGLFDGTDEERAELIELASRTEPARLRRMFRALVREIEDLSWAPRPTAVLEMAVIRLATLPAGDDVGQLLTRLDQLERRLAAAGGANAPSARSGGGSGSGGSSNSSGGGRGGGGSSNRGGPTSDRGPRKRAEVQTPDRPSQPKSSTAPRKEHPSPATSPASTSTSTTPTSPTSPTSPSSPSSPSSPTSAITKPHSTPKPAPGRKTPTRNGKAEAGPRLGGGAPPATLFDRLRAKALDFDRSRYASLEAAELLSIEGHTIALVVGATFHVERLRSRITDLEAIAAELFGQPVKITVELNATGGASEESSETREQARKRRQDALNSESVNLALKILDAEIVEIRPLGENR
jgi:hypothetical protein